MKTLIALAAFAVATIVTAAPAHAQSANEWRNREDARDPGYQSALRGGDYSGGRARTGGYNGGGYYNGYPPYYYEENTVRRNTARRNRNWYKACPNGDPAVPIDVPCPGTTGYSQPQTSNYDSGSFTGVKIESYVVGGYFYTVRTEPDGRRTVQREPANR